MRRTVLAVVIAATLGGGIATALTHRVSPEPYGSLPSFLPRSTLATDSLEVGTDRRPALTSQGDAVKTVLPDGSSVVVTVAGPEVPGEGLPFQASADTATWTITMSHASRTMAIHRDGWSVIDSLGHVYALQLVPGQPAPPATIAPGQTVSYELRVVLATGEGMMRWAPEDRMLLGTWDFVVEND